MAHIPYSIRAAAFPPEAFRLLHPEGTSTFLTATCRTNQTVPAVWHSQNAHGGAQPAGTGPVSLAFGHPLHQEPGEPASWERKINLQIIAALAKAISGA